MEPLLSDFKEKISNYITRKFDFGKIRKSEYTLFSTQCM